MQINVPEESYRNQYSTGGAEDDLCDHLRSLRRPKLTPQFSHKKTKPLSRQISEDLKSVSITPKSLQDYFVEKDKNEKMLQKVTSARFLPTSSPSLINFNKSIEKLNIVLA